MKRILLFLFALIFLAFFFSSNKALAATCGQAPLTGSFCTTSASCNNLGGTTISGTTGCSTGQTCCQENACETCASKGYTCGTFTNNCGRSLTCANSCTSSESCSNNKCINNTYSCGNTPSQFCSDPGVTCAALGASPGGKGTCPTNTNCCIVTSNTPQGGYDCTAGGCVYHSGAGSGQYSSQTSCNAACPSSSGTTTGQCPVCPDGYSYDKNASENSKKCTQYRDSQGQNVYAPPAYQTCSGGQYCYQGTGCAFDYNSGHGFTNGKLPCSATNGQSCPTAIGNINTDPQGLVKAFFGIVLSFAGALAVLLIIISGYRLTMSRGNPEAVQGAREQFTAAVVGLIFIIISFAILRFVGVDLLNLFGQ